MGFMKRLVGRVHGDDQMMIGSLRVWTGIVSLMDIANVNRLRYSGDDPYLNSLSCG